MKKKLKYKIVLYLFIFLCVFTYLFERSSKTVVEIGKGYYESKILAVSYMALNECLTDKKDELNGVISLEKDKNDDITFVSANSYKLNVLSTKLANRFLDYFSNSFASGVPVPIGVFSGLSILSGFGKKVNMNIIAITNVRCVFYSEFSQSGINQTRHCLKLMIIPQAKVVSQRKSYYINKEVEVIIFDNLIIGKVPDTYLNGKITYEK